MIKEIGAALAVTAFIFCSMSDRADAREFHKTQKYAVQVGRGSPTIAKSNSIKSSSFSNSNSTHIYTGRPSSMIGTFTPRF